MCDCKRLGTDTQVKKFDALLDEHRGKKDNIMVVLQKTQNIFGYIPELAVSKIANALKMPESEIYGIISFIVSLPLHQRLNTILMCVWGLHVLCLVRKIF